MSFMWPSYDDWKTHEPEHDRTDDYTDGLWRCDACEYDRDCGKCWQDKCQCACQVEDKL